MKPFLCSIQVYCQSHVPKTGPGHLDGQSVGIKAALNVPKKNHLINEQIRVSGSKPALSTDALTIKQAMGNHSDQSTSGKPHYYPAGHFDASALHIQHAVNQTKLNRSTNGLRHSVRPGIESRINDFLVSFFPPICIIHFYFIMLFLLVTIDRMNE